MPDDPILTRLLAAVDLTAEAHRAALDDLKSYVEPDPAGGALVPVKIAAFAWGISENGARKRCREGGVGLFRDGKWFVPRSSLRA